PQIVFDKYGVDALRYYLLSSPLMKSEDLNFSEKDVDGVYKKLIQRLSNVLSFYELYAGGEIKEVKSKSFLDRWILSRLAELREQVTKGMEVYEIDQALRPFDLFIDDLSTWYLRRSRERLKGENSEDKNSALSTIRTLLLELSKLMAPFTPFIAESIYQKTKGPKGKESVHLEMWPDVIEAHKNVLGDMTEVRRIVTLALEARSSAGIKVRQPLASLIAKAVRDLSDEALSVIADEVNVKKVSLDSKISDEVVLDTNITPELKEEGEYRELVRAIQDFRKESKLQATERISFSITASQETLSIVKKFEAEIKKACNLSSLSMKEGILGFEIL
ncbi:MAG: class I tRNA ligase family protein, partial [Candidatus Pacebacteria bacterium]|nr:class I tRNA ligase family protein [Candidatus Paceibacterota bacterium]